MPVYNEKIYPRTDQSCSVSDHDYGQG